MSEEEKKSPVGDAWLKYKLALVNVLSWPLTLLPRRLLLALGGAGGRLVFHLWPKRRRVAIGNIEMIKACGGLPAETRAEDLARESFANMGQTFLEAVVFYHRGLAPFLKYCRVEEGGEFVKTALEKARGQGRAVLFVTGHMGNWEIMCQFLTSHFACAMSFVGRDTGQALSDVITRKLRTKEGNSFIAKRGGAMEMMRLLKAGGNLGTLIDQAVIGNHPGTPIPFLGKEASTNLGPLRLARRAQAQVLMVLFRREGLYHYMKVLPTLEPSKLENKNEALIAEARQLNDWLGEHIQKYPAQWMWGHRRWKSKAGIRRDPDSIV